MTLERTAAETIRVLKECTSNKEINLAIDQITESIIKTDEVGKLITIFGNGGSAADAQHWSGELVCTYSNPVRKSYRSIALTTDSSVLTAWPNDFEFETVFERQIISMGNIMQRDFFEIWNSSLFNKYRRNLLCGKRNAKP